MKVSFKVRGLKEVQEYLRALPRGTVKVALAAIAEWMIGTPQRGLKHYRKYKYISRKKAYGKTFASKAQQGYVMAAIAEGRIDPGVPHRTGRTQRGWYTKVQRQGYEIVIGNKETGAYYTRDDVGQARLNMLAGWLKTSQVIANNMAGALRHAQAAVSAFLKKR